MKLKETIQWIKHFLMEDIWTLNMEGLSRTKARLIRDTKVVISTVRKIGENNAGLLSASLCYFCTMAVVPFLAVCFALTGGVATRRCDALTGILLFFTLIIRNKEIFRNT